MRKPLILLGFLGLLFLASCQSATPTPEPTQVPTDIPPTPTQVPSPEPTVAVDYCVDCHTDKEQLISVAAPVEEGESESSGVG